MHGRPLNYLRNQLRYRDWLREEDGKDIEALLVTHPAIEDAGVIAAPSERWGETPLALVVPAQPGIDAGELLAWANGELGRQQRLADLLLVDELPRNPNGKMLKRELRERYGDRRYA